MRLQTPSAAEFKAIIDDKEFPGSGTTGLLGMVSEQGHEDPVRAQALMRAAFAEVYRQWKILSSIENRNKRSEQLHISVDASVNEFKIESSCKKGCAHCCYLEVSINDDEALQLANRVMQGVEIDIKRLKAQAEIDTPMRGESPWREHPKDVRKCVFLGDDNLCRIYDDRPAACRKYFVASPPELCEDIKGTSSVIGILPAEITVSAAYNIGKPDSIAKKLLPLLENL